MNQIKKVITSDCIVEKGVTCAGSVLYVPTIRVCDLRSCKDCVLGYPLSAKIEILNKLEKLNA